MPIRNIPARVNRLALSASLQLLHSNGPDTLQVVGARVRNDGIPNDGFVGRVIDAGPLGGDVDEDLLGVPCEERGEVGFERELDDGVFLLLGAIIMGTAFDSARRLVLGVYM